MKFASYIEEFQCRDVVLDGNWSGWANWAPAGQPTPACLAYVDGFKLSALKATAKWGCISNVHIINCGANGLVPQPHWVAQNAEAFPLYVNATAFMPGGTNDQRTAWFVEDCEVSDFHAVRGGYCTAIMVCTPYAAATTNAPNPGAFPDYRTAEVRRCMVRGSGAEIAFGSSCSAGVSFHDNVAVGVGLGLNHDTGGQRNFDLINNIFLDVRLLANIGGAGWGPGGFTNYTIAWNATRMRHVPLYQLYSDYEWRTNTIGTYTNLLMPTTDPALALGRCLTGYCAGLRLGGADNISFQSNRFTTRPVTNFFEPNPTCTSNANWRPLYCPTNEPETGRIVNLGANIYTNDNVLSSVAFDFTTLTNIDAPTLERPALTNGPAGFSAAGFPGRVQPDIAGANLMGVYEVSLSDPVVVGGQVEFKARYLHHPSSLGQSLETQVLSLQGSGLHGFVRSGPNAGTLIDAEGITNNAATFRYYQNGNAGRDEIVVCNYPLGSTNDFNRDGGAWASAEILLGTTVRFERTPDVANDRRVTCGTARLTRSGPTDSALTVTLQAETLDTYTLRPAMPGDHYELRDSSGVLIPMNTNYNTWQVTLPAGCREVTVRVQPRPGFGDAAEFEAAYLNIATSETEEYAVAPPGPWVTTYPHQYQVAGNPPAAIAIWDGPRYRAYPLYDYYWYQSGSQSGLSGDLSSSTSAAEEPAHNELGEAAAAEMVMEETAGFTLLRRGDVDPGVEEEVQATPGEDQLRLSLEPTLGSGQYSPLSWYYIGAYSTAAYALSEAASPLIAGIATYYNPSNPQLPLGYFTIGGWWAVTNCSDLIHIGTAWGSPVIMAVDNAGNVAGSYNSKPCYVGAGCTNITGVVTLPSVTTNAFGQVLWLPPASGQPVGWSYYRTNNTNYARPTRWEKAGTNWQTVDLLSFTNSDLTAPGYAYMANDAGVTVGKSRVVVNGTNAWRAFRTDPGDWTNRIHSLGSNALALPPKPTNSLPDLLNNSANGVTWAGDAVGATDYWYKRGDTWTNETRAVLWWAGSYWAAHPAVLGTVEPNSWALGSGATPGRSEALAANRVGITVNVVGTSWTTPTGYPRAFIMEVPEIGWNRYAAYSHMLNLNDPHLTYNPEGLVLTTAEAINEQGWIVGNGTYGGVSRAFLLVPQDVLLHGTDDE